MTTADLPSKRDSAAVSDPTPSRRPWRSLTLIVLIVAGLASAPLWQKPLSRLASTGNRNALWSIVHGKCMANLAAAHGPAPCLAIDEATAGTPPVAILKDLVGKAQLLAIPTVAIPGLESPLLEGPAAPDLFGAAWRARPRLAALIGKPVPADAVGLAMNSSVRRSQDQAHVHVDCLSIASRRTLAQIATRASATWSAEPVQIGSSAYIVRTWEGADLSGAHVPDLVAAEVKRRHGDMALVTIAVAGLGSAVEARGFLLLLGLDGEGTLHGEDLLDHTCAAMDQP